MVRWAPSQALGRRRRHVEGERRVAVRLPPPPRPRGRLEGGLERRRGAWAAPELPSGGYQRLYCERVMQANLGADFDFLIGTRGHEVPRPSH